MMFILHRISVMASNITLQAEIIRASGELYCARLLCELAVCLWKEQRLDSARLEDCHSLEKACVKWLGPEKSL